MGTALKLRLARSRALLELIDLHRTRTRYGYLGAGIEKRVLDRELNDLERATETAELAVVDCQRGGERVRPQPKRSVKILVRIGILVLFIASASASPGWLDRFGGHSDRRKGGYHFHRGVLAGRQFPTKEQALTALWLRQSKVRGWKKGEAAQRFSWTLTPLRMDAPWISR